jgi:hypothetical protein
MTKTRRAPGASLCPAGCFIWFGSPLAALQVIDYASGTRCRIVALSVGIAAARFRRLPVSGQPTTGRNNGQFSE